MIALFHGNNFLKIQLYPFLLWGEDQENHRMESLWPWSFGDLWFWQCALVKMARIQQNDPPWLFEAPNKIHCWFARLFDFHQMEWFFKNVFFQDVFLNYSSYSVLAFSHSKRVGPPHLTLWHVKHAGGDTTGWCRASLVALWKSGSHSGGMKLRSEGFF